MKKKERRTKLEIIADKRRSGRPRKYNGELLDQVLTVRFSARERRLWTARAAAAGLPLGAWLLKPRRDEKRGGNHGRN